MKSKTIHLLLVLIALLGSLGSASAEVRETVLVERGSPWQYWDRFAPYIGEEFDYLERYWNPYVTYTNGFAPLGYGDDEDQNTRIGWGNSTSKEITAFFLRGVYLSELDKHSNFEMLVRRDDGVIVFVNGQEVLRDNLPAGPIDDETTALTSVGGDDEDEYFRFPITSQYFKEGHNIIGAEVHQFSDSSSDLMFDLELRATIGAEPSVLSAQHGNYAHFLLDNPARLISYNMENKTWSPPVDFSDVETPPVELEADADGIFVAFADRLFHVPVAAGVPEYLISWDEEILSIELWKEFVYLLVARPDDRYGFADLVCFPKATGIESSRTASTKFHKDFTITPAGLAFSTDFSSFPSTLRRLTLNPDGSGLRPPGIESLGRYGRVESAEIYRFPGDEYIVHAGSLYRPDDMRPERSLAGRFENLREAGDGSIIIQREGIFSRYSAEVDETLETGRIQRSSVPVDVYCYGDSVFLFKKALLGAATMPVEEVALSSFVKEQPVPVDPDGLIFHPEQIFEDRLRDELIFFDVETASLFRWSLKNEEFVGSIPLGASPNLVAYSPELDLVYVGRECGRITSLKLSDPSPSEQEFFTGYFPMTGMFAAGSDLMAYDSWYRSNFTLIAPDGKIIDSSDSAAFSNDYVWNEPSGKFFFIYDSTYPTRVGFQAISEDGVIFSDRGVRLERYSTEELGLVRPNEDGTLFTVGTGEIIDVATGEVIGTLPTGYTDLLWDGTDVLMLRSDGAGGSMVEQLRAPNWAVTKRQFLPGEPFRIFRKGDGSLQAITLEGGVMKFSTLKLSGIAPVKITMLSSGEIAEGDDGIQTAAFDIALENPLGTPVTLKFKPVDGSATMADGDFDSQSVEITFAGEEAEMKQVEIPVYGDRKAEADERFSIESDGVVSGGQQVEFFAPETRASVGDTYQLNDPIERYADEIWFSPDGSHVVYLAHPTSSTSDLYSTPVDGATAPVRLNPKGTPGETAGYPKFSADSSTVYFAADSRVAGQYEFHSVPIDGGPVTLIADRGDNTHSGVMGSWITGDGQFVHFERRQRFVDARQLYRVPIGGGPETLLGGEGFFAEMSPDGQRMAYISDLVRTDLRSLVTVHPWGDVQILNPYNGSVIDFKFGPNGSAIAYRDSNGLWAIPVSGGSPTRLDLDPADPSFGVQNYEFTPDGKSVIFTGEQLEEDRIDIFSAAIDGSRAPARLNGGYIGASTPRFKITSDSQYVIYTSRERAESNRSELMSARVDGEGQATLLSAPVMYDVTSYEVSSTRPEVSYSARHVDSVTSGLYLVPAGGGDVQTLTEKEGHLVGFVYEFSKDGNIVFFQRATFTNNTGPLMLHGISTSGGDPFSFAPPPEHEGIIELSRFRVSPDGKHVVTDLRLAGEQHAYYSGELMSKSIASVTILNDDYPPVAVADALEVLENGVLERLPADSILNNDTDEDREGGGAEILQAELLSDVAHGTLDLRADGSLTYTPSRFFSGTDSFAYRATDGVNFSEPASVEITVVERNGLSLSAAESRDPVFAGSGGSPNLSHTIEVTNHGPGEATQIMIPVAQTHPPEMVDGTPITSAGTFAAGVWVIPVLADGATAMLTFDFSVNASVPGLTDAIGSDASATSTEHPDAESAAVSTSIISPASIEMMLLDDPAVLEPPSGLYTLRVQISNHNALTIPGLRLVITGLPPGVTLYNATGIDGDGNPYIEYPYSTASATTFGVTLEFFSTLPDDPISPIIGLTLQATDVSAASGEFEITRLEELSDGAILIEWNAEIGSDYQVQYSDDLFDWTTTWPAINAQSNRAQWVDRGMPKTSSFPSATTRRYYRVIRLEPAEPAGD